MRELMTLLILVSAATGYVYLQQPQPVGEPYDSKRSSVGPFVATLAYSAPNISSHSVSQQVVGDRIEKARMTSDSTMSEAPAKAASVDAFERLRKLTESFASVASGANERDTSLSDSPGKEQRSIQVSSLAIENPTNTISAPSDNSTLSDNNQTVPNQAHRADDSLDPAAGLSVDRSREFENVSVQPHQPIAKTEVADQRQQEETSDVNASSADVNQAPLYVAADASPPISDVVSRVIPNQIPVALASNRSLKAVPTEWKVVGKTTEGRPMHALNLGEAGMRTFIIAGLNGDDRTAVRWLELLSEELNQRPELLKNVEVVFFRAGNPDGLVRNMPNNSRGVSINRNFPSRRYRPSLDVPVFAVPAGEIETRVILESLYTFRPRRVIHLSSTTGRPQVLYNRSAKPLADEFERSTKLAAQRFDSEQFPGSLEDFADGTLEAAVISMRLAIANDWKQTWNNVHAHVLSVVTSPQSEPIKQNFDSQQDSDRTLIPTATNESAARTPRRRRGYEELPPPPLR